MKGGRHQRWSKWIDRTLHEYINDHEANDHSVRKWLDTIAHVSSLITVLP